MSTAIQNDPVQEIVELKRPPAPSISINQIE